MALWRGQINQGWSPVKGEKRFYYGWVLVATSFITLFMVSGVRNSFSVFFTPMLNEFGWSRATTSLAVSIGTLVSGMCLPVMGRLVDRYGPKVVIFGSTFLMGISVILLSTTASIWHFYLLYGVTGGISFAGAAMIPNNALIARWFVRRRGLAMSVYLSGFSLGQMILIPFAAYLILLYNWQTAYLILGGLLLATVLPTIMALVKDSPEESGYPLADAVPKPLEKGASLRVKKQTTIVEALKTRSFLLLIVVYFICGFTDIPVVTHFVTYASDIRLSETVAADALGLMNGIACLGTLVMGSVSDKFGRKNPLALIYLIRALSLFLPMRIQDAMMLNFFSAMFGFVIFSMNPISSAWIGDTYGKFSVGRLTGVISLVHGIGAAIGTYFFGVIFDLNNSYNWAFQVSILLAFIASMCAFLIKEKRQL